MKITTLVGGTKPLPLLLGWPSPLALTIPGGKGEGAAPPQYKTGLGAWGPPARGGMVGGRQQEKGEAAGP